MPRGIPKKKEEQKPVPPVVTTEATKIEKAPEVKVVPKLEPLAPGQAYFESPDGEIIIGDDSRGQVWSRKMNGGKGGWINRKR